MKKKILIAEDDPFLQKIFQLLLERKGYEVVMIFPENMERDYSAMGADLFLLDLHLAGFSGHEICKRIKSHPDTRNIPVIMISSDPRVHAIAKQSGAEESIEKPFDTRQLFQAISFHLP